MYFRSNKKNQNTISLNDTIGIDKDGDEISLIDIIPSNEEDTFNKVFKEMNIESLHKYLNILNKREKEIIIERYGLFNNKELTQKEVAQKLGISQSYISRIEKRALTKLYKEFYRN